MIFWGFDLGDGESALARVDDRRRGAPEIVEVAGETVTLTAWAVMKNGEIRIGENAARSASSAIRSAVRFKSRFLDPQSDSAGLIRDFSAKLLETVRASGALSGGDRGNSFYIGCPAGWSREDRQRYQSIFETLGCPSPRVISESRAVMVGAVQSNAVREHVDLRAMSVLVVDIGSSTTDFAYILEGREAEIRTGGEVALGGGILDEILLEACVASSPNAEALRRTFAESEAWRVDSELRARRLKERYYTALGARGAEDAACGETLYIAYDEPALLDLRMDAEMAETLTGRPCRQLGGRTFREVFCAGLRKVRESIAAHPPELVFLTGGVSRMPEIRAWCGEVFPEAVLYTDAEPEFSVARGLAWCGRIDSELGQFRAEVEELVRSDTVERIVRGRLDALWKSVLDSLLDPLLKRAVKPVLLAWRDGKLQRLSDMETALQEQIRLYLHSEEARGYLYRPVTEWLRQVEKPLRASTAEICRKYHVPDHALEISSHFSASDLRILEKIETHDVLDGQGVAGAAIFVESVISILAGLLCGGGGTALIAEGPVGIAAGIVLAAVLLTVGTVLGKKTLDQKLMDADLPLLVRRLALSKSLPRLEAPGMPLLHPVQALRQSFTSLPGQGSGQEARRGAEEGGGSSPAYGGGSASAHDGENSPVYGRGSDSAYDSGSAPAYGGGNTSALDSGSARNGGARVRLHLLPQLSWPDENDIPERRLRAIRSKVQAGYDRLFEGGESAELQALNERICAEISEQIEQRLLELAKRVEIPL